MFTLGNLSVSLPIIWFVLTVILLLFEGVTLGLNFVWFAVGALLAGIASLLHLPFIVQFLVFVIGSVGTLITLKPVAVKVLKIGSRKTNLDNIIGKQGYVLSDVTERNTGQVSVNGQIWTAATKENQDLLKDTKIEVVAIEGVKLIVKSYS